MSTYGRHTVYTDGYSLTHNELLPVICHNRPNCSVTLGTAQNKDSIAEFTVVWDLRQTNAGSGHFCRSLRFTQKVKYNYYYLFKSSRTKAHKDSEYLAENGNSK